MVDDDALWLMYGEGFNGHESETGARWKAGVMGFLRFLRLLCVGDGTVLVDSGADSKRSRRQH